MDLRRLEPSGNVRMAQGERSLKHQRTAEDFFSSLTCLLIYYFKEELKFSSMNVSKRQNIHSTLTGPLSPHARACTLETGYFIAPYMTYDSCPAVGVSVRLVCMITPHLSRI